MPAPTATSPSGTAPPSRSSGPWRTGTWRCGWRGASSAAAMPSPGSGRASASAGCWSRWTTRRPTPGASRSRPNRSRSFRDGPSSRSAPRPRPARLGGDEGPAAGASRAGPRARARRRAAVVGRSDAGDPHRAAVLGPRAGCSRRTSTASAAWPSATARRCGCGPATASGSTTATRSWWRRWRHRRPTTSWSTGRSWHSRGAAAASPAAAAHAAPRPRPGPPQRGGGLPVPVRRAARGRLRPDWPGAAAAQGRAAAPAGVSRPPPVHPPSQRRRRGLRAAGLPEGLGGGDRQAGRRALRARAVRRLAEVQVRHPAGAGDRWLYRPQGVQARPRRPAARLLPRRRAGVRRQGRDRLRPGAARAPAAAAGPAGAEPAAVLGGAAAARGGALGAARAGRPDRLQRMDQRRAASPSSVPGAPGRQASTRGGTGATAMSDKRSVKVGRRTVEVSNPGKILYPDGITKGDLVDYYRRVAKRMLPHLRGRPVAMERYPDGIDGQRIFQKDAPDYFPDWIERVKVHKEGGSLQQVACDQAATLVYLANQACITPHVFLSRADRLDHPDQLIFDLDPAGDDFEEARLAALALRDLLRELELPSFAKTTGGKGLHLTVPLDRRADFDTVRGFARDVADLLAARQPDRLTTEQRKDKRKGRLYLDAMRNAYAQTAVPPYAARARPSATVATPLDWSEVEDRSLRPSSFTIASALERTGDPWKDLRRHGRSLSRARSRLNALIGEG